MYFHCEEKKPRKSTYDKIKGQSDIAKIETLVPLVLVEEQQTIKRCRQKVVSSFSSSSELKSLNLKRSRKAETILSDAQKTLKCFVQKGGPFKTLLKEEVEKREQHNTSFIQSRFMAHCFLYLRDN